MAALIFLLSIFFAPMDVLGAKSAGCGGGGIMPQRNQTFGSSLLFEGNNRTFNLFFPGEYDGEEDMPLVVGIHGWGGTSLEDACDSGLTAVAMDTQQFATVHLQGMQDYSSGNPSNWGAWHFNGSTSNGGVSCDANPIGGGPKYCYDSNVNCTACDWTDGVDDVAFVDALLDALENEYCIDTSRVYVSGQSNGGMMTYQLGASLSHRLAAIAPISGSMHWQHAVAPLNPVPVLAVTGVLDGTVPGNGTSDGKTTDGTWWYYSMDKLAELWSQAQQCDGITTFYPTSFDGVDDLWCKSACSNIDHVLCSWSGMHNYFTGVAEKYIYECTPEILDETYYRNGQLVWEFFSKHARESTGVGHLL
jgi:polyhydroxybutyrate depolymerase